MIRKFFCLLSLLMSTLAWGQADCTNGISSGVTSSDILTPGRSWLMSYEAVLNPDVNPATYYFEESVLLQEEKYIDGICCLEIATRTWSPESTDEPWRTGGYLGEQDGKVYLFEYQFEDELVKKLIMDYSLTVGDTYSLEDYEKIADFSVVAVSDTIMPHASDAKRRICMKLDIDESYLYGVSDVWVEGIGSARYGILGTFGFLMTGSHPRLIRCMQDEQLLYETDDFSAITGLSSPKQTTSIHSSSVYDLQGRRLQGVPQRGLYVKDGKKHVVVK